MDPTAESEVATPRPGGAAGCYMWPACWLGAIPHHLTLELKRDEPAPWPSLEELEDVVREVDVAAGVAVRAHRDGMLVFDFASWAPTPPLIGDFFVYRQHVLRRVTLMNGFLACLYTAVSQRQHFAMVPSALTPGSIFSMDSFTEPKSIKMPNDHGARYYESARYPYSYGGRHPMQPMQHDERLRRSLVIAEPTLDAAIEQFRRLLEHERSSEVLALAELLVRSASSLSEHDDSQSLMLSWAIVEASVGELWRRFYSADADARGAEGDAAFMPRGRAKALDRLNVSTIIEMLSLADRIPFSLYRRLRAPREARNGWIHSLRPVEGQTAGDSLGVAQDLLQLVEDVTFQIPVPLQL